MYHDRISQFIFVNIISPKNTQKKRDKENKTLPFHADLVFEKGSQVSESFSGSDPAHWLKHLGVCD